MSIDYNERAARGQALNLATHQAISEGKGLDKDYIVSLIPFYLDLSNTIQNLDLKKTVVRQKL